MLRLSIGLLSCLVARSTAILLPFEARPRTIPLVNDTSKDASNPFRFFNVNNFTGIDIYVALLTAGGTTFEVQLDTGSADLWLDTSNMKPLGTQDTGLSAIIPYADGSIAQGPVLITNVTFGNFTVPQALISAPGSNATSNGDSGLLGLGPPSLSIIAFKLQGSSFNGASLLGNIFAANPSEPNFITFQLSRSQATGTTSGGTFTIGEVNSTFSGISSTPRLDVVSKHRWTVFMDGIIVDGKNVTGNSQFNMTGQGPTQTVALLDTGTPLGEIPKFYADAIYSGVPGAQFDPTFGVYYVPCDTKINLSFVFGGIAYPVHPIDTVQATTNTDGTVICISGFLAMTGPDPVEDMVLGNSLLRNVYSLYDFGSFTSATTPPFVQLLSTTDESTADSEFCHTLCATERIHHRKSAVKRW
ncbi:acid protease [Rickenella mellea]|uniref:Acid protease n=1 Tax=Rickenella mellea TaxID=50990 RepID=A0A4Y7PW45_9AGAM|nr:acid protease [Rickenella mellea]